MTTHRTGEMVVPFQVKAAEADESGRYAGTLEGYAAAFLNLDRAGDIIVPGAFNDSLQQFKTEGFVAYQHDWDDPIGKPIDAHEDERGLYTKSRISKTTRGINAMTLARDGVITKMSIGYRVKDAESVNRAELVDYVSANVKENNQQLSILKEFDEAGLGSVFLLKKVDLYEISLVTVPANPKAEITSAKNLGQLASLKFADHSIAVLAAVKDYAQRARDLSELRKSEGRRHPLNETRREEIKSLSSELASLKSALDALTVDAVGSERAVRLYAHLQMIRARHTGALGTR